MTWACAASPCAAVHESQHLRSSWPTTGRFVTIGLGPYKAYGEHRQTIDLVTRATADRRTLQIAVLLGLPRGGRVKMNLRVAETNELIGELRGRRSGLAPGVAAGEGAQPGAEDSEKRGA